MSHGVRRVGGGRCRVEEMAGDVCERGGWVNWGNTSENARRGGEGENGGGKGEIKGTSGLVVRRGWRDDAEPDWGGGRVGAGGVCRTAQHGRGVGNADVCLIRSSLPFLLTTICPLHPSFFLPPS